MNNAFDFQEDLLLKAPTGSGKTLAFLLPLLSRLIPDKNSIQALIIVPTRELALQIESVFKLFKSEFKVTCCYGGHDFKVERNSLLSPPALLIGTPGRIKDHIQKGTLSLFSINTLIFDEFDKSLEIGFEEDMKFIIQNANKKCRKVLVSATNTLKIPDFVALKKFKSLSYEINKPSIEQLKFYKVFSKNNDKIDALIALIQNLDANAPTIVFCNHREVVERIAQFLNNNHINCECFHGKLEQIERELVIAKFKNMSSNLLITTDLAARGIDISEVKNIIHYQNPLSLDINTHRNGRTARMNSSGAVFYIYTEKELLPPYLGNEIAEYEINTEVKNYKIPLWATITINKGKKDSINKTDIVGFFIKTANLKIEDIGLIEVKDFISFVAINRAKLKSIAKFYNNQKIKNKVVKIHTA